jgi:hypothetical protein
MSASTSLVTQAAADRDTHLRKLTRRAVRGADFASKLLVEGVDDGESALEQLRARMGSMSDKDFLNSLNFLERVAMVRLAAAKAAGLGKHMERNIAPTVVNQQINVNLPLEERIRLIQAQVQGIPLIQPPAAQEAPRSTIEAPPDPTPTPAPERPARKRRAK